MGIVAKTQNKIKIKFSNKFLPSLLVNTAQFIDDLMRLERLEEARSDLKEL